MPVQVSYETQNYAQRGVINGVEPHTIASATAPATTNFAVGVNRDATKGIAVTGPIFGITAQHQSVEATYPTFSPVVGYPTGAPMAVVREGSVWCELADPTIVAEGDLIGINTDGEFASSTVAGFVEVTNAVVEKVYTDDSIYVSDASLVLVRVTIDPTV